MMSLLKLHLGCGKIIVPDAVNVDIRPLPGVDKVYNLEQVPWPWPSNSAREIIANHVVEHLHLGLIGFLDECWRILAPGGACYIEVPDADDPDLGWADPSHIRPYRRHSFINYITLPGIEQWGLTTLPWTILQCITEGGVVKFHGQPAKGSTRD
jgi:SAM-dependent methyltransferase